MAREQGILTGLDKATNEPKLVVDVASGKACNCYCAHCGYALLAKKGKKRVHHFSHAVRPPDIRSCQETDLHMMAKIVAAKHIHHLYLPERKLEARSTLKIPFGDHKDGEMTIGACNALRLSGSIEPLVPEISPYRPDARVKTPWGTYYVEIQVTHPVPSEKQKAMQDANLAVLEIDLSTVPRSGFTIESLCEQVKFDSPRSWLSFGCNDERAALVRRLDAEVLEMPGPKIKAPKTGPKVAPYLMDRLGAELESPLPETIHVHHIQHRLYGHRMGYFRYLPVRNVRRIKGFTMADLPGIPDVLVTGVSDEHSIISLFVWHQAVRNRSLTVLSMGTCTAIFTNSLSILRQLLEIERVDKDSVHQLWRTQKLRS